ncbi:nuclear transport factor 2 family protein [Oscillatoria sp. FACHB-1407]|uniref:nuclear transport factor 2 family protein n=1 Tax=Oscillatoria sp. FACHB-1407 TaxID=2692847 RepID=UPI0016849A6C|nr:nuclear transport factor 2 family protein [Oscillatoria sp. FACHB-1407]MBD2460760.1 nuclear transport factor 2 family protein [Oscillatoria sp. FACHB-1407]
MLTGGSVAQAQTESSNAPPPEVATTVAQIDAAANQRNLDGVMQFFGRNFVHADGLTRSRYEDALQDLWERYPVLTYQTEINTWQQEGAAIVYETTTTITGTQVINGQDFALNSTMRSRQRLENGRIVRQETLSEQSRVTTGENPPTVDMQLPEQVMIGRSFNFDAIVQEPLGTRLLLGSAIEEPINTNQYFTAAPVDLELLSAGGLFKVGRAPALPDSRWISAVIIREDGITLETRRLRVVGRE